PPATPSAAPPGLLAGLARNLSGGLALLVLRRRWPPRFVVNFDQVVALLILDLAVWAGLDALHAEAHAPLALDGLFGWGCYLLLALGACAIVARAHSRAADTRALLVPALSVAPFVLTLFWLASDRPLVQARPVTALVVTLVYMALLCGRVLGAAYAVVRTRATVIALARVFAERFGAGDRSVLLVNDVEDRDSYPLASVSGLAQTLKLLAARMHPDDDVLVLFLTSHGSQDGLEVENGSLPLSQLAPADLREALDDAEIRWRVVVVSACYAGVFLDELKSDTTAIITAADATHTSFGCEDNRELTWFGEAFLKDSLAGSPSLEEAFHKAAALVARREDAEHQAHSNPQLYVGPLMRRKLA